MSLLDELKRYQRSKAPTGDLETVEPQPEPDHGLSGSCVMAGCRFRGRTVELGTGLTTRLCKQHRRALFLKARERAEDSDDGLLALRACSLCNQPVLPEDDPCSRCVAADSPLVRFALALGARPLCPCGVAVDTAGDVCPDCLALPARRIAEEGGEQAPTVTGETAQAAACCSECDSLQVPGTKLCIRHLRGHLVFVVDRLNWPRLELPDGRTAGPGLIAWCPVLRDLFELDPIELARVVRSIEETRG